MRLLTTSIAILVIITMASFTPKKCIIVTSYAFKENGQIPVKYTCMGQSASPPFTLSNIPENAVSLAIVVDDPDAMMGIPQKTVKPKAVTKKGSKKKKKLPVVAASMDSSFVNWVIWNIDTGGLIPENFKNDNEGMNGMKERGYTGLCPVSGTHHFHFKVYALDTKLNLNKNGSRAELEKIMQGHIVGWGEMVGTFDRNYR